MIASDQRIASDMGNSIAVALDKVGVLYRVFSRAKSRPSVTSKVDKKRYGTEQNPDLMQDYIGIRVALYFSEDLDICMRIVRHLFNELGQSIDAPSEATFMPVRCNVIYQLPAIYVNQLSVFSDSEKLPIDKTFEVQFRTILSEGWHEVEHDLRYKCESDWKNQAKLSRSLNGVLATLETCDWSMIQIFEQLSYRHYKRKEWLPMLRHKMRMRMAFQPLSDEIVEYLDTNLSVAKRIFRTDRGKLLIRLFESGVSIPLIPNNVIFLINHFFVKDEGLARFAPEFVTEILESIPSSKA